MEERRSQLQAFLQDVVAEAERGAGQRWQDAASLCILFTRARARTRLLAHEGWRDPLGGLRARRSTRSSRPLLACRSPGVRTRPLLLRTGRQAPSSRRGAAEAAAPRRNQRPTSGLPGLCSRAHVGVPHRRWLRTAELARTRPPLICTRAQAQAQLPPNLLVPPALHSRGSPAPPTLARLGGPKIKHGGASIVRTPHIALERRWRDGATSCPPSPPA